MMGGFAPLDLAGDHIGHCDGLAANLQDLRRRHPDRARPRDRPLLLEVVVDLRSLRAHADDERAFAMINREDKVVETTTLTDDADRLRSEVVLDHSHCHRLRFVRVEIRG